MRSLLLLLTLLASACGSQHLKGYENADDPDVIASMTQENLRIVEGTWMRQIHDASNSGEVYISFHEDQYEAQYRSDDGTETGTDAGKIRHWLPGDILLVSDYGPCRAYPKTTITQFLFRENEGSKLRLIDKDNSPLSLYDRREEPKLPRSEHCFYEFFK